jgi:tape measure domain-containing protein
MAEPRVDLKIGVDFEDDISLAVGKKFQQLAADVDAAFTGKVSSAASQTTAAIKETASATDTARERLRDYGAQGSVLTGIWAGWNLVSGAIQTVTQKITEVGRALLDAQIFSERFAITMKLATGGNAAGEMDYVRGVVNKLGLELQSAANYYALFMAASRDTRIEGQKARDVFEAVASASAVMGLSAWDTEGVFRALTQMISKGTVQAEEMRGQLGERLPGAFQIAARAMGVTTGEFSKMLERGQVISTEFLPQFARQLREEFGGSVEQASQRTEAALNRLSTAWLDLKTSTAQAGVGSFMAGQLNILTDAFTDIGGSMRAARADGDGFWGQFVAGTAAVLRFINPLNAVNYQVQSTAARLTEARTELTELAAALEEQPNNLLLKNALADTQQLVRELEAAQAKVVNVTATFTSTSPSRIDAQIDAERAERQSRAMKDLQTTMVQVAGVNEEYERGMQRVNAALQSGAIDAKAAAVMQDLLRQRFTESGREAAAAAEKAATYRRELEQKVGALEDAAGATDKLTKGEKLLADLEREWATGKGKLAKAEQDLVRQRLARVVATEKAKAADDAAEKSAQALLKANLDSIAAEGRRLEAINAAIDKQIEENAKLGLGKEAMDRLNIAKQETILLDLERKALVPELSAAELNAVNAQISAQQTLIDLMKEGAAKRVTVEAAEEGAKAWKTASETIESALTDALLRGFESGKSFLENLVDTAKNLFATLVLRPIIQPLAQGSASGVLGLLGMGGSGAAAAAAGGGGNSFSALGALGSLGSLGSGIVSGLSGAGSMAAMSGLWANGSYAAAGGMGLGMAAPYIAAAYAAYRIISGVGTGRDRAPAFQQYGIAGTNGLGYAANTPNLALGGAGYYNDLVGTISSGVDAAVRSLGGTAGNLTYGLYSSTGSENSGAYLRADVVDAMGKALYFADSNGSNDSLQSRIEAQFSRMFLAGLQGADLAPAFAEYFGKLDIATATQEQIDTAIAAASAAKTMSDATATLGGAFTQLSGLSVDARNAIIGMTGGLDSFLQKAASFVELYYTGEEQAAIKGYEVGKALAGAGIDIRGLDTKEEFRTLVESIDASTQLGQQQLAAALNVAAAFAELVPFMQGGGIDLAQLAGGVVAFRPGESIPVIGPSPMPEDEITKVAPWLEPLKAGWADQTTLMMTNLNTSLTDVGSKFSEGMNAVATTVANSVSAALSRPVQVTVVLDGAEVNGGRA